MNEGTISVGDDLSAALMSGAFIQPADDADSPERHMPEPLKSHDAVESDARAEFFQNLLAVDPQYKKQPTDQVSFSYINGQYVHICSRSSSLLSVRVDWRTQSVILTFL